MLPLNRQNEHELACSSVLRRIGSGMGSELTVGGLFGANHACDLTDLCVHLEVRC